MCCRATDMINELSLAISKGLTAQDIASVIHPHPTFGEGIIDLYKRESLRCGISEISGRYFRPGER